MSERGGPGPSPELSSLFQTGPDGKPLPIKLSGRGETPLGNAEQARAVSRPPEREEPDSPSLPETQEHAVAEVPEPEAPVESLRNEEEQSRHGEEPKAADTSEDETREMPVIEPERIEEARRQIQEAIGRPRELQQMRDRLAEQGLLVRTETGEEGGSRARKGIFTPVNRETAVLLDEWQAARDRTREMARERRSRGSQPYQQPRATAPRPQSSQPPETPAPEQGNTPFTADDQQEVRRVLESQQSPIEAPLPQPEAAPYQPPVPPESSSPETSQSQPEEVQPPNSEEEPVQPPASFPDKLEIHTVNIDKAVRERAVIQAERELQREIDESKGVKKLVKTIWKGTLAHEYYRQRYIQEAEAEIREHDNQFHFEGRDREAHEQAGKALIDRLIASKDLEGVELGQGEKVERLGESEGEQALAEGIRGLIGRYASGELDADSLREERSRLFNELREEHPDLLDGAHTIADNLITVAEQAKGMVDHGASLEDLLQGIEFYGDQARAGVRTEAQRTSVDAIIEKLTGSRVGSWANEATIATAVSVAYSASQVASKRTVGAGLATILPGIGTGIFAGLRENMRYKQERAQHMRERAEGMELEDSSPRRERMEEATYETRSAKDLLNSLEVGAEGLTEERRVHLKQAYAEIRARQRISDVRNIDLISYSDVEKVDQERLELELRLAQVGALLKAQSGETGQQELAAAIEAEALALSGEVKSTDRTFQLMKSRAVASAAAKGVMTGLTFGIIGQEAAAAFTDQHGLVDSISGRDKEKGSHVTFLKDLFQKTSAEPAMAAETMPEGPKPYFERVDGTNTVKLPDGYKLHHHGEQGLTLDHGDKTLVSGLEMNEHGFTAESERKLEKLGITSSEATKTISHSEKVIKSTSASRYVGSERANLSRVERTLWYDNDTVAPVFDQNELRLWWGNEDNSGISRKDNYVFNVSQMSPDGSFHTPDSANAQELIREGKLKVLLSANEKTQTRPFSIPIDKNGNAIIPKDSVAGKSLFTHRGDQAIFRGRYAEVAQITGEKGGRDQVRILATYEGKGVDKIRETVTKTTSENRLVTTVNIPAPSPETPPASPVDAPPFMPINWRRGMEPLRRRSSEAPDPSPLPYEVYSPFDERPSPEMSPRLAEDPERDLSAREELAWYFDREAETNPEYVADLDRYIEQNEVLRNLPPETSLIVSIPVAGAHESENIYETLKQYAAQDSDALSSTVFLLNVNWPEDADLEKVGATLSEIERAKRDFPALQVASLQHEMSREWISEHEGHIYGSIIKRLYDTGMRATQKAVDQGTLSDENVFILTNDADAQSLTPHYLRNYVAAARSGSEADVMYGFIRWGTKAFADYPGYAFTATMMQAFEHEARKEANGYQVNPATWGPNSAFKVASLAAIGGVNGDMGAGADSEVGYRIWRARSEAPQGTQSTAESAGYESREKVEPRRRVGKVVSAIVDSSPERILSAYTSGKPVVEAWNSFDEGGFTPRSDLTVSEKENIETDYDQICGRIEYQMTNLMRWFHDERLVESALNNVLPPQDTPLWEFTGSASSRSIKLTDAGKSWLRPRLGEQSRALADRYEARRQAALENLE